MTKPDSRCVASVRGFYAIILIVTLYIRRRFSVQNFPPKRFGVFIGLWLVCVLVSSPAIGEMRSDVSRLVSDTVDPSQEILPANVLSRVELLRKDLDDIRFEMGRPKPIKIDMMVLNAAPHEVFFQARSLYRKADQLVVEVVGGGPIPLGVSTPQHIQPLHVLNVVNAALERLQVLKKNGIGITSMNSEPLPNPSVTPSEVFFSIGLANQQLNILLNQHFTPADVSRQVRLAILYTQRLLQQFPQADHNFLIPELDRGRRPGQVFIRLLDCHEVLAQIAQHSQLNILELGLKNRDSTFIHPNEVYDIASLVVSELAYLYSKGPQIDPPQKPAPPGLTLPSHVYQQVGNLLLHLKELETQVKLNPQWLQS